MRAAGRADQKTPAEEGFREVQRGRGSGRHGDARTPQRRRWGFGPTNPRRLARKVSRAVAKTRIYELPQDGAGLA